MSVSIKLIQDLKFYLDPMSTYDEVEGRIKSIEDMFSIKKGEEGYPTHKIVASHTSFIMKNKEKIVESLGEKKYADTFCQLVRFLEQNPEKVDKKSEDMFFGMDFYGYQGYSGGTTIYGRYGAGGMVTGHGSYVRGAPLITYENTEVEAEQPQGFVTIPNLSGTLTIDNIRQCISDIVDTDAYSSGTVDYPIWAGLPPNNLPSNQITDGTLNGDLNSEENNEGEENV